MIVLSLPYPISANRYWRTYMPRGFAAPVTTISKEAKAYRAEVALAARLAGVRSPLVGRVAVDILLYPKRPQDWTKRARQDPDCWDDTVMCLDLDNANKVLFDSLKGVAIEDDKWVRRITSQRMEPDGEARVIVTITQFHVKQTQPSLALETSQVIAALPSRIVGPVAPEDAERAF